MHSLCMCTYLSTLKLKHHSTDPVHPHTLHCSYCSWIDIYVVVSMYSSDANPGLTWFRCTYSESCMMYVQVGELCNRCCSYCLVCLLCTHSRSTPLASPSLSCSTLRTCLKQSSHLSRCLRAMKVRCEGTSLLACGPLSQQQFDHHQRFSTKWDFQHSLKVPQWLFKTTILHCAN